MYVVLELFCWTDRLLQRYLSRYLGIHRPTVGGHSMWYVVLNLVPNLLLRRGW